MPTPPRAASEAKSAPVAASITEEQLIELIDQLYARIFPQLVEQTVEMTRSLVGENAAELLELPNVDVEGMLACAASESVAHVIPALFEARKEFAKLTKNRENPHFGSSYADLAQIFAVTEPGLTKNGLILIQTPIYLKWAEKLEMFLQTRIVHTESLEWLQAWWLVEPLKRDPQGFGSAMTYGKRYPAQTLLGLASEDDDGNAAAQRDQSVGGGSRPQPPKAEVSAEELAALSDTIDGIESVEAIREMWNDLGAKGKLTDELKAKLNARATEINKAAKTEKAAEAAEAAGYDPQGQDGGDK